MRLKGSYWLRWDFCRRFGGRVVLFGPAMVWALSVGACCAPYQLGDYVLTAYDGAQIRRELVERIVNDPDLTEAQRRDQLRELGIGDDLVELLLETSTTPPAEPEESAQQAAAAAFERMQTAAMTCEYLGYGPTGSSRKETRCEPCGAAQCT